MQIRSDYIDYTNYYTKEDIATMAIVPATAPINFYWDNTNGDDSNNGLSEAVKTYEGLHAAIEKFDYKNYYPIINIMPSTETYSAFMLGTYTNINAICQNKIVLDIKPGAIMTSIVAYQGTIHLTSTSSITNIYNLQVFSGCIFVNNIQNLVCVSGISCQGGGWIILGTSNVTCTSIVTNGGGYIHLGEGTINCTGISTAGGGYINFGTGNVNCIGITASAGGYIHLNTSNIVYGGSMSTSGGYIYFYDCNYRQTTGNMACIGGGYINFSIAKSITGINAIYCRAGGEINFNKAGSPTDQSKIQFAYMVCLDGGNIILGTGKFIGTNNGKSYPTNII